MFILSNLLDGISTVINYALTIFMYLVIARAVLSWVNPDPYNPIVRFIYKTTEPTLSFIRSKVPSTFGGMDFAPIIVFLVVIFLQTFLVNSLRQMATLLH